MSFFLIVQFVIVMTIVFGAVLFFLKKILYNDTQSAVNRLDRVYQDLLSKQKELAQKIEQAEKEYKQKKEEAGQIAEKMKQEAMDEIRKKEDEIVKAAKVEADDMVQKARSSVAKIRRDVEKEVRMEMIDFVMKLLSDGINEQVLKVMHQEMIKDFIGKESSLDFSTVPLELGMATVKTPFPLTAEEKEKVKAMIDRKLKRSLEIQEEEDKGLIAGIALGFGTLILDGSFSHAINSAGLQQKRNIELEA
ncbi:MAG: F0F1 ATP synthase subunit delta [Candidatus Omnitrophota bacterium]